MLTQPVEPRAEGTDTVSIIDLPARREVVVTYDGPVGHLPAFLQGAFERTAAAIVGAHAAFAGPPFARYLSFDRQHIVAEAGFPFRGDLPLHDDLRIREVPAGRAVTTRHVGPYESVGGAWHRGTTWMHSQHLEPIGPAWEQYVTAPDEPGPAITDVVWPIGR